MPWAGGESGNPKGRPKGTTNRLITKAFKQILEIEGNEPSPELIRLLQPMVEIAFDPKHPEWKFCLNKVMKFIQAELRHELSQDEQDAVGGLLGAILGLGPAIKPSDDVAERSD